MKIVSNQVAQPKAQLIFAHGAGAGKESDFMQQVALEFEQHDIQVVRFDFPYMEKAAALNKRQPPNPMGVLQQDFLDVIAQVRGDLPCFIGGKSMGGRVATLIADKADCRGIVCFGYPFHPPGKPEKVRTEHLFELTTPLCIVQGERDTFGKPDEIQAYRLPASIKVHFLPSGDHSFKPLKSSGENQTQLVQSAVAQAARFLEELL